MYTDSLPKTIDDCYRKTEHLKRADVTEEEGHTLDAQAICQALNDGWKPMSDDPGFYPEYKLTGGALFPIEFTDRILPYLAEAPIHPIPRWLIFKDRNTAQYAVSQFDIPLIYGLFNFTMVSGPRPKNLPQLTEYAQMVTDRYKDHTNDVCNSAFILQMLNRVLNRGWKPNFDTGDCGWHPMFTLADNGFSFNYSLNWLQDTTDSHVPPWMLFKDEDTSDYAAIQFLEVYKSFFGY